jgi:two-component system, sensor histidine kinase and response regulator
MGLDPAACSSGEAALALMRSEAAAGSPFHYVLAEREMPGLSGAGLASAAREDASLAATEAVVLMVPHSLRRVCGQLESSGVRGFLSKPVRMSALAGLLTGRTEAQAEAPAASGRSARREPVPASAGAPLILIVEDNLVNQRVAVRLVEKMGYRAAVVNNGREALEAFRSGYFDLILMDCQMPEMDGFTATNEIRLLEVPGSRTPIIAMTANAMRGDRDRCIAAGMDDYISKPVGYEDLRVMVTRWLARAEVARL